MEELAEQHSSLEVDYIIQNQQGSTTNLQWYNSSYDKSRQFQIKIILPFRLGLKQ